MSANPLPFTNAGVRQAQADAEQWMVDDLARSGLTPEYIMASAESGVGAQLWPDVSLDGERAKGDAVNVGAYVASFYSIPYWTPKGEPLEGVAVRKPRFKSGTPLEVRKQKYARPSKKMVGDHAVAPYMHPARLEVDSGSVLDIHEGEKKAACAVLHGQCAVGIAGCNNWGDPEQKGQVHPWIAGEIKRLRAACGGRRVKVRLWADADYKTNPMVAHAYSAFAAALALLDVDVVVMDLSALGLAAKFDDMVVALGYDTVMMRAVEVPASELPENPELLAKKYQLLTQPVGRPPRQLPQAIATNFDKLLSQHPKFNDRLWLDLDRQKAMIGEEELAENVGDHHMLHFFQEHLGFNGAGRTITLQAMRDAIAHRIALDRRSPFNDRVRAAAQRLRDAGETAVQQADAALNQWVVRYLSAPDTEWNRRWGRKLLMAIVGRALQPGCPMRTAFCLAGPQGIGKTHFLSAIVGESNVALVSRANSQGKDLAMTYAACLVAVHDEMAAMTNSGLEHVKSDISTRVDLVRLPYGRNNSELPRRCVFYVPVDKPDFLFEDSAGMTRFAVLDLLGVDFAGRKFDFPGMADAADVLLGAAWLAVEAGERFDEVDGAAESAMGHVKTDLNMELITDVIESPNFAHRLHEGDYKGRRIIGFRLADLISQLPPGFRAEGGAAGKLTGPLRKLGFTQEDPNKNPLGVRRLWFMDKADFDEKFTAERRKYD